MSLSNRPSGLWAKLFVQTPRLSLPAGVEVLVWVKALPLVGLMSTWELAVCSWAFSALRVEDTRRKIPPGFCSLCHRPWCCGPGCAGC